MRMLGILRTNRPKQHTRVRPRGIRRRHGDLKLTLKDPRREGHIFRNATLVELCDKRSWRDRLARLILRPRLRERREGTYMATVDRNRFLRGALAAGAASFASSVATNYTAHLEPSPAVHGLANVLRLLDAASDRLSGALADPDGIDPDVVAALENIKLKARAIAAQVETALPLG
jgi:hypothetical protein